MTTKDELNNIKTDVAIIKVQVKEMHKELMGNGRAGLITRFNKWEGAVKVIGFILGSGTLISICLAIFLR